MYATSAIPTRLAPAYGRQIAKTLSVVRPNHNLRATISPMTGPFDRFTGSENVLVIADIENWAYGARDLGFEIDFAALARLFKGKLKRPSLHAFFSAVDGDDIVADRLAQFGWEPQPRAIIQRPAQFGMARSANADLAIAFGAAKLLGHKRVDAVLLGTGDGVLALDCARAIRTNFKKCFTVGTVSLSGSTSRLLDARVAKEIDVNVEIGMDAMRPLVR
jgi:uncharacterized LabA/DUF88 family protein